MAGFIELPSRQPGGTGGRRAAAAPTAADVQQVRIARDPGVRASPEAFGAGTGQALQQFGETLTDFGAGLARVSDGIMTARRKMAVASATTRATADLRTFTLDLETDADVETYSDRFKQRAETAFNTYSEGLDEAGKAEFRAKFEALSLEQAYEIRKLANARAVDGAVADLDTALDGYAGIASQAGTDEAYGEAVAQGTQSIDAAMEAGLIDAVDGGKRKRAFAGRIDEVVAMQEISRDPEKAAEMLADPSLFPNLDEKRRQSLLDSAVSKADIAQRRAAAEADRQDRLAEKRMSREGEALLKGAYEAIDAGSPLTPDQLDAMKNHPGVSAAEYKGILKLLENDGTSEDDGPTVAYLMTRLHSEDISTDLTAALDEGLLKTETYRTLMNQNQAALADDRPASPYKSGRERIKVALDPGQLGGESTVRQALSIAQVSALEDFDNFAEANPDMDRQSAMEQARTLTERYQNVAFGQMRLALPRPRGYGGSKEGITMEAVEAARDALADDIEAGRLTSEQAAREIDQLNVWENILNKANTQ